MSKAVWITPDGKPPQKPKRVVLITMTLKGICKVWTDLERVNAKIYFNDTTQLYGIQIEFIHKHTKSWKYFTDLGIKDPYKHLEYLMGCTLINLQKDYGGYITLERFAEHIKIKGFNANYFKKMELAEVSPL